MYFEVKGNRISWYVEYRVCEMIPNDLSWINERIELPSTDEEVIIVEKDSV